jgi:hypothetical protein
MRAQHFSAPITILWIILMAVTAAAEDDFVPVYGPSLHIQRAAGDIEIDGRLDDPGWRDAAVADQFVESEPGDQIKPPVDTRAGLTYDDEHLYVSIIAQADPEQVRASLCERDHTPGDDNLGICIDTYGHAAWAYVLFVNAYGVQYDAIWTDEFGTDTKYDLIWEAAGCKTDSGFQVEFAIPFASLRFPDQEKQEWRVEFFRYHEREVTYEITWSAYDRNESCWPCQWGTVTGLENVKPGRGMEIIPAVIGFQSGSLERDGNDLNFRNKDFDGDISVSARYSISSSATAEVAVNPDFSQVEADADQIDVNSTTALSFPEKRPFFQEGSDLFQSRFGVVYTRSINEPDAAAKFTYRKGRTSLGYLGAVDRSSPLIIPFSEFSSPILDAGRSYSNIMRLRQTFGKSSRIGFLATDRRYDEGGSGSTIGLDGKFQLAKGLTLSWQTVASHTAEPEDSTITADLGYEDFLFDDDHTAAFDGESFWGHAYLFDIDFEYNDFFFTSAIVEKNPTFRTDSGIETLNNSRYLDLYADYNFRFDDGLFRSIQPNFYAYRIWDTEGAFREENLYLELTCSYRLAQASNHNQYWIGSENYADSLFEGLWGGHHCFSFTPGQLIAFGGSINYGHKIARGYREVGSERYYTAWLDLQPLDRWLIENSCSYIRYTSVNTGAELFEGYILRSKLTYHFNSKLWLRYVTQYNDFSQSWDFDPLLTYQLNPFTLFYIGTTYDLKTYDNLNSDGTGYVEDPDIDRCYSHTKLKARQFFVKLQYLFQQ